MLYGERNWRQLGGCIQVSAIAQVSRNVIAIGPAAPRSTTDRFVLGFARARADVILTTGAILRAEPELRHRYAESEDEDRAWAAWRSAQLGRSEPPRLLVLSRSGDFPVDHAAFAGREGWLFTGQAAVEEGVALPSGFEQAEGAATGDGPQAALDFVMETQPGATLSIEAGPTTAASFYGNEVLPNRVDELLLSRFEGALNPTAVGPPFVEAERIASALGVAVSEERVEDASGPWCFARYRG